MSRDFIQIVITHMNRRLFLNSADQQFNQYQQNKKATYHHHPFSHWTQHDI